jgi:hypothetical protein
LLRAYDKLGVSNRVELVLYALTHRDTQAYPEMVAPRTHLSEAIESVGPNQVRFGTDCRDITRTN